MRSLLPGTIYFPTLLFLSYLHMALGKNGSEILEQRQRVNGVNQSVPCESSTTASSTISGADSSEIPQPVSVFQIPAAVKVTESSTVIMECLFQTHSSVWYIQWFKNGTEGLLKNTNRMSIISNMDRNFSHLILNKTEVADSGIYTCRLEEYNQNRSFPGNGTQLTVEGITDLMVNQTPDHINQPKGTNVTIQCQFRNVSDYNSIDVRWYRNQEKLNSTGDSLRIALDRKRGFTSLTLINAAVNDSGDYRCEVESKSRNLTGSGKTSRVDITASPPGPEHKTSQEDQDTKHDKPRGTNLATIGTAAGAGVAVLLLMVAGVFIWKHRSRKSRSEPETSPAKETELHPPLVQEASEVTYADLRFQKREVKPDAEVVYAEVRGPRKQQACQDAKQVRPRGNQGR